MNPSSSQPDAHEEILAQFVADLEQHGSQAIQDYLLRHPDLAGRIHGLVKTRQAIQQTRPEPDPGIPERLGEFRILREISHGGMGRIYEAEQERLNRRVAVKVIRRGRILPEARDRFLREQEVLARLHQTNIVAIHTAGEEGPLQYFVMPYIEGAALHHVVRTVTQLDTAHSGSKTRSLAVLARRVVEKSEHAAGGLSADPPAPTDAVEGRPAGDDGRERSGSLPAGRVALAATRLSLSSEYFRSVAEVLVAAAEALHHAHRAGILHRDVKPANLMVEKSGRCWLIDFGLAGYVHGQEGLGAVGERTLVMREPVTISGIMGTPQYMAPEQFKGKADPRTDVWGLGVTLYELLTLRPAFEGESYEEIRGRVTSAEPSRPGQLVRGVPADLEAICRKAMSKQPGERYQTAQEFADDLKRWLRMEPTQARRAWPWRRVWLWARRNKGWAAAIVTTVLAVVVVIVMEHRFAEARYSRVMADLREAEERRLVETQLLELQRFRLGLHSNGWFGEVTSRVKKIADIRKGEKNEQLRDQYFAALAGLDAKPLPGLTTDASSVVFSGDGKRLLAGGSRNQKGGPNEPARLWKMGIDKPHTSNLPGDGPVAFAGETPLQLVVADARDRFTLELRNVEKQVAVRKFKLAEKMPPESLTAFNRPTLALAVDGSLVAASIKLTEDKSTLMVWEVASGKQVKKLDRYASGLAFSPFPDGQLLAIGGADGEITIWKAKQDEKLVTLQGGRARIHCLAFGRNPRWGAGKRSEAGKWLLASGDAGGNIDIWDLDTRQKRSCRSPQYDIYAVAFSLDSAIVASAGRDYASLWAVGSGRHLLDLGRRNWMTGVAFSPDGKRLAVTSRAAFQETGGVDIWELEYGRGIQSLHGFANRVAQVNLSPDGRYLAALSDDWSVAIWEMATGKLLHVLEAPVGYFTDNAALAFSPDGKRFAFSTGTEARLWDFDRGVERTLTKLPPGLSDRMAFNATGKKLLLARMETRDGKEPPYGNDYKKHPRVLRFRNLLAPDPKAAFQVITEFNQLLESRVVAPDGSYFVIFGIREKAGVETRMVQAYDGDTGKQLWEQSVPVAYHQPSVSLDPTGQLLRMSVYSGDKVGGGTWTITLLEMPSGKQQGILEQVCNTLLGPEMRYYITLHHDGRYAWFLFRRGEGKAIVAFDRERLITAHPRFNPAGTHVMWGSRDGVVSVLDLAQAQRRLAEFGFGW